MQLKQLLITPVPLIFRRILIYVYERLFKIIWIGEKPTKTSFVFPSDHTYLWSGDRIKKKSSNTDLIELFVGTCADAEFYVSSLHLRAAL